MKPTRRAFLRGTAGALGSVGLALPLLPSLSSRTRAVDPDYATADDQVGFADGFPFLLISQASLDDLNARLDRPLPMLRFRPNLVVKGCEPYAEDSWRRIRIGALEFRVAKACSRCVIPTIDFNNAERGREPLQTLMTYRRRFRYGIKIPALFELVIYDENNPRSLAYQLSTLEQHISQLPHPGDTGSRSELERLGLETATLVRLADLNRLAQVDEASGRRETLQTFLDVLNARLPALSDALTASYFRVAETPHQLVQLRTRSQT